MIRATASGAFSVDDGQQLAGFCKQLVGFDDDVIDQSHGMRFGGLDIRPLSMISMARPRPMSSVRRWVPHNGISPG